MKITAPRIVRTKWSSERAFVLATAAAAVGLGNLWRFPYMTGENGGASFIIAYIIAVLSLGIPLMIVEISAGRFTQGGPVKTFRALRKHAQWFGWLVILLTMIIMSYYLVITGWTLGYTVDSLTGGIKSFAEFTSGYASLYYFLAVSLITGFAVARGVKMIELLSRIMMPLLVLIILFLTSYSLTLPGTYQALGFLFTPDFSSFLSPTLWALAFGQAFYSLAIGQGYLITYGSFVDDGINLPRATGIIAIFETTVALIAGLMIFPLVFTFGLDPAQGSELAFATLPVAFSNIPLGSVLAIGFFSLFFLAAISSCIAGMEVIKTTMREELRLTQLWATVASFMPILPLGVLAALSFSAAKFTFSGRPFLEILDMFAANQIVIILGLVGGAIIAWNIPLQPIVNSFSNRYRRYASHVVIATKYLWVLVLAILVLSFIL
mgnify:CR=1 FL=1